MPFIARYRKEATAGLDDTRLRQLDERLGYLRELEDRRASVIESIREQGKLSEELQAALAQAETKTRLEDLYAPYKPKRRTRAQIAREAGLEPLLEALLEDPTRDPLPLADAYLNPEAGVAEAEAALEGARQIFMERAAEQADLVAQLREWLWDRGRLVARAPSKRRSASADRQQLLEVTRLGPRAFEQAAGFLRIRDGSNPLDASAVHPEAYPVVERILQDSGRDIHSLIGDSAFLNTLAANDYTDDQFGEPTVRDIIAELDKPGRDPRPEFKTASFRDGVETLRDLQPGMLLEGVISNVTNFGAFVDIGVHQDGLVHISALADRFVRDPREVVRAGQVVKVKVMEVDIDRKRVGLSMRLADEPGKPATPKPRQSKPRGKSASAKKPARADSKQANTAIAAAFARVKDSS
ncbi:S1 RNA-binding domain-containing protein [Thiohalophilus sp.]|uniref:S1 RNA-binding domain-containing protein n=1 Tax=Thiohalophilus sp. TaxID=3028392 RepID=UPI002ACD233F|nr:Tex-like N-terminal domain-containing protein [Thiohalophilus sp.]MDZ7662648.1 Tex-like N-terminal domain-containing protein [Thiohalophilus sp.]